MLIGVVAAGLVLMLIVAAVILDRLQWSNRKELCDRCEADVIHGKVCPKCGHINDPAYVCLQCEHLNLNKPDPKGFAPCSHCGELTHQMEV